MGLCGYYLCRYFRNRGRQPPKKLPTSFRIIYEAILVKRLFDGNCNSSAVEVGNIPFAVDLSAYDYLIGACGYLGLGECGLCGLSEELPLACGVVMLCSTSQRP